MQKQSSSHSCIFCRSSKCPFKATEIWWLGLSHKAAHTAINKKWSTWFLMPSSPERSVVLSWKTINWKILPLVPTACTVIGRSNTHWGWHTHSERGRRRETERRIIMELCISNSMFTGSFHRLAVYIDTLLHVMCTSLPHRVCVHGPEHFRRWTWASWLWTVLGGAYIEHQLHPGSKVCGHEGKGSHPWNLIG